MVSALLELDKYSEITNMIHCQLQVVVEMDEAWEGECCSTAAPLLGMLYNMVW